MGAGRRQVTAADRHEEDEASVVVELIESAAFADRHILFAAVIPHHGREWSGCAALSVRGIER